MPLEGLQLGHYHLLRLVGSGGMGEVYLAEDPRIHRQVALKVIRTEVSTYPGSSGHEDAVRLFQREAKAIAMLDHPHILPLYDYGEQEANGAQFTYLVMPFRPEGSLTNWLRQHSGSRLLSSADVVHFIQQAAGALQYAHDRQIIHQDVKPSNFLIRENAEAPNRPDLLLTDFGVAKLSTATSSVSHSIRGTPTYMAPEQWSGDPVLATDQYALAVMAYELLVGRPPFVGPPMRMMYLHTNTPAQPPSELNPQLPADIDSVLLHALAKQPQERFASITSFANAFRQALQDIDIPTIISSAPVTDSKDLQVTLAISQSEAISGTQRTLTLPSGRKIQISVPANAYDGQILRLDPSSGSISPNSSSTGLLVLKLAVKQTAESITPLLGLAGASNPQLPTVVSSNPHLSTVPVANPQFQETQLVASQPRLVAMPVTPPPINIQTQPPPANSCGSGANLKGIVLVALALLILVGSAGFFFYTTRQNQPDTILQNNTSTADATATAQTSVNATATAQANVNALATTQTSVNATATAQVSANATATSQANVNATATAQSSSSLTILGGLSNLSGYCQSIGDTSASLNGSTAYNWSCVTSDGQHVGISMTSACRWQYNDPDAEDRLGDYFDPYSWQCFTHAQRLGGLSNLSGYCQSIGDTSASLDGSTAYNWSCVTTSGQHVGMSITNACRWQYNNSQALDRLANYSDPYSWECWG